MMVFESKTMMHFIAPIENLKACSQPNTITLFRSPVKVVHSITQMISRSSGFQSLKPTNPAAVTSGIFQYVILFRGGGPGTLL